MSSEAPKLTAAEKMAAIKAAKAAANAAKAAKSSTKKNNNSSSVSSASSRKQNLATKMALLEARMRKAQKEEEEKHSASAASSASATSSQKPSLQNEVIALEAEIAELQDQIDLKTMDAEEFKERRAASRNRRASFAQSLTGPARFSRPSVRTSAAVAANAAVEEINKAYAKMVREIGPLQTKLRDLREKLDKKRQKMSLMADMPTPVTVEKSTRVKKSAAELAAELAALKERHNKHQTRKSAASQKKNIAATKKLERAYQIMSEVDKETQLEFCRQLQARSRSPSPHRVASPRRSLSPRRSPHRAASPRRRSPSRSPPRNKLSNLNIL